MDLNTGSRCRYLVESKPSKTEKQNGIPPLDSVLPADSVMERPETYMVILDSYNSCVTMDDALGRGSAERGGKQCLWRAHHLGECHIIRGCSGRGLSGMSMVLPVVRVPPRIVWRMLGGHQVV